MRVQEHRDPFHWGEFAGARQKRRVLYGDVEELWRYPVENGSCGYFYYWRLLTSYAPQSRGRVFMGVKKGPHEMQVAVQCMLINTHDVDHANNNRSHLAESLTTN